MTFARVSIEDIPVMCVSERGAEGAGCSRGSIPGGTYLRARLRGEPDDTTPRISETFAAMAAAATSDLRSGVEFYRRRDEVDLLFPIVR